MTAEMLGVLAPGLHVQGGGQSELIHDETLAYQPANQGYLFAVVKLANGRYAAIWQAHAWIMDTFEQLTVKNGQDDILNKHEIALIQSYKKEERKGCH
jgi:hypothetical protein